MTTIIVKVRPELRSTVTASGEVLAVGDVNGDGVAEVAIGVPHEIVGTVVDAGMVYVTRFFDAPAPLQ